MAKRYRPLISKALRQKLKDKITVRWTLGLITVIPFACIETIGMILQDVSKDICNSIQKWSLKQEYK